MRILIVDDDDSIRTFVADAVEIFGFSALQAADGMQALHKVAGGQIDLILLDLMMPGVSGQEVIAGLRNSRQLPRIVVMTAAPHLAPPGFRVLEKPFSLSELLSAITCHAGRCASPGVFEATCP